MQTYTNPEHLETLRRQAQQATKLEFLHSQKQKRLRGAYKAAKYALHTLVNALLLEPMRLADSK
jgi:hypothetical protein